MVATSPRALALLTAALVGQAAARAEDRVAGAVAVYRDDDHVTVISPTLAGRRQLGPVTADARLNVDVISAASVDLVTAASPAGFHETRTAVDTTLGHELRSGRAVHAGYGYSGEPDFTTHSGSVGGRTDVLDRQATVTLDYSFSHSRVGRTDDSTFARSRDTHHVDLGWSHVLSPRLVADVGWGLSYSTGFQANPYRMVRLYRPGQDAPATAVAETAPDHRLRHVLTARLRARPARRLFAIADYRVHVDDWGLVAHTATARAVVPLIEGKLDLGAELRGYTQTAVDFYRPRYDTFPSSPELRTANKELGPMRTLLAGLVLDHTLLARGNQQLRTGLGVDWLHIWYLDYPPLPERTALVVTLDLEWNL